MPSLDDERNTRQARGGASSSSRVRVNDARTNPPKRAREIRDVADGGIALDDVSGDSVCTSHFYERTILARYQVNFEASIRKLGYQTTDMAFGAARPRSIEDERDACEAVHGRMIGRGMKVTTKKASANTPRRMRFLSRGMDSSTVSG